jgi:protease IV
MARAVAQVNSLVAEEMSLVGSIGVIRDFQNRSKVYSYFHLIKTLFIKGKFVGLETIDHRALKPDELDELKKKSRVTYNLYMARVASSKSINVKQVEEHLVELRVFIGKEALMNGLIDDVGGFDRAIAVAKFKADIAHETIVDIIEVEV